ncbi:helix-turn-helix transcriptional regulator [Limnobacter sp.]|uniref:helix-turn-helix domain-containing protein n=1 Tax=Limnobacter sp. TaxID=2003368 RepID=UPI0025BEB387|nr:helix-turn-helix transcriptional regulator [Limnobacter sp.]
MPNTKERLPVAVTNLRKIWSQKKHEMQITQVEAADKLGWTQGALSQYLNGITELGPSAVIKLANFLGVDPEEIDPAIGNNLPGVRRVPIRFNFNSTKPLKDQYALMSTADSIFRVQIKPEFVNEKLRKRFPYAAKVPYHLVCIDANKEYRPRSTDNEPLYLICRKGETEFDIAVESQLPPASSLSKKFAILGLAFY